MGASQQNWQMLVGDGAGPEVFTQIANMIEVPEFTPRNLTIRDDTYIDVAAAQRHKKHVFNNQIDGAEMTITLDYDAGEATHQRLDTVEGTDAGCNFQFVLVNADGSVNKSWDFNCLVYGRAFQGATSNEDSAKDQVSYTLKINGDPVETTT